MLTLVADVLLVCAGAVHAMQTAEQRCHEGRYDSQRARGAREHSGGWARLRMLRTPASKCTSRLGASF
jgi:hypothetical protein